MYYYDTPVGKIGIVQDGNAVTGLYFTVPASLLALLPVEESELHRRAAAQLYAYFSGKRKVFELPISPRGTPFQCKVWEALQTIPYGETRSYGQIAAQIGNSKASRAVGMANNRNPISILIPCHRVIGADGKLTGYGGGMHNKEWLLALERMV